MTRIKINWKEILTDEEIEFIDRLGDLVISTDMQMFQIKKVMGIILEYDNMDEFTKTYSYQMGNK
jgi:hypothetical protein